MWALPLVFFSGHEGEEVILNRHEITGWIWQATLGGPRNEAATNEKIAVENQPFLNKKCIQYIYKWWRKSIAM